MKGEKKLKGNWRCVAGSVYEAKNGDRIHLLGNIKPFCRRAPQRQEFFKSYSRCMDIMGQNNKRALMLVCEKLR